MEELLKEIKETDYELYLVVVKIYKGYGIEIKAKPAATCTAPSRSIGRGKPPLPIFKKDRTGKPGFLPAPEMPLCATFPVPVGRRGYV